MTTELLAQVESGANSTDRLMMNTDNLDRMYRAAEMMASARVTVPKHLAGSPGDCLAVIMQAMQWGMNPFAVAQKTHLVNGALGYEAQLVNAVISTSSLLATRIDYEWEGEWKGVNGKTDKSDDRAVTVLATLKGEAEPRRLRVSMAQVGVRNSPNWESDPRQQLAYLATKKWARLYAPDVMLGVYTPDELDGVPSEPKDMGPVEQVQTGAKPTSRADRVRDALAKKRADPPALEHQIGTVLEAIGRAQSIDELHAAGELAKALPREEVGQAREAFKARRAELEAAQQPDGGRPAPEVDEKGADAPTMTYAQVREALEAAATSDALDAAADLIGSVTNTVQREELTSMYRDLREKATA